MKIKIRNRSHGYAINTHMDENMLNKKVFQYIK